MNYPRYEYSTEDELSIFEFESVGSKGKVKKVVQYTEMTIKENKDDVLFKTKGREFTINKNDVSLESFREKSKIIAPMISHKAEKAKDFNEILMKQHEQKKSIKL